MAFDTERPAVVFMFAGQGCQFPGMAQALYRHDAVFRDALDEVDALIEAEAGRGVLADVCDPAEDSHAITRTHPGLFAVQIALAAAVTERGLLPDYVVGLSTGEIAAATVGGALTLDEGVRCIVAQTRALDEACDPGGMLAVVGPPAMYDEIPALHERTELALAGRSQFVVAGDLAHLADVAEQLAERAVAHRRLPVRVGFHSPLIEPGRGVYLARMAGQPAGELRVPLGSCALGDVVDGPLEAAHYWEAISRPMRFVEAVGALAERGRHSYVDLGPGSSLTALLKQTRVPTASVHTLLTPYGDPTRALDTLFTPKAA
jgi:acyl transferase domain-containing protein